MPDGEKETRELNVLPHPFSWTADLDLAEASAATASTEMVLPTLENPTGYQSSHVGDPRFKKHAENISKAEIRNAEFPIAINPRF